MLSNRSGSFGDRPSRRDLLRVGLWGATGAGAWALGRDSVGASDPITPSARIRRVSLRQPNPQMICPLYWVGMMGPYSFYMGSPCPIVPNQIQVHAITSLTPLTTGCVGSCIQFSAPTVAQPAGLRSVHHAPKEDETSRHCFARDAAHHRKKGLERPLKADESFQPQPGTLVEVDDYQVEGRPRVVRLCTVTVKPFEHEGVTIGPHRVAFGMETAVRAGKKHPKIAVHDHQNGEKYYVLHRKDGDQQTFFHVLMHED